MFKIRRIAAAASLISALLSPAFAATTVYFGEDLGAGSAANLVGSLSAREQFVAAVGAIGVEDFESHPGGTVFPAGGSLSFAGSSITATITGGQVRNAPFNARFAVDGDHYLDTSFTQRIVFSAPVDGFGLFVIDANEVNNNPAVVTVGGSPLSASQIDARPFDSVDGIFRIVTERAPGVFEVLFNGGTFPATDSTGLFVGLVDRANPYSNIILINGTSGLDVAFQDGFGYDGLTVATAVPEPSTWALLLLGAGYLVLRRSRRAD